MKTPQLFALLACYTVLPIAYSSRVLELSDKFSDIRKEGGQWLVMFYAPWCGHCKRLEPVWAHVAQSLTKTPIRVGKIDCTRFNSLAREFHVGGFPTIKFIKPDQDHTFQGDRSKEEIVNFAIRMSGPAVQDITKADSINTIKSNHKLFFMYVGEKNDPLWETYSLAASKLQPHAFFFAASGEIIKQSVDIDEVPSVFVYKDGLHHFFPRKFTRNTSAIYACSRNAPNEFPLVKANLTLEFSDQEYNNEEISEVIFDWLNEERFEAFPKVTRGNINELLQTKKYIVLAVIEENKLGQMSTAMSEFRDMVESVIRQNHHKYHKRFQFGWTGNPAIANSIAMTVLPLPYLLVLNSTTNHHHLPEDEPSKFTEEAIDMFLESIHNDSAPIYGGNGALTQVYRAYFEATTSLGDMWKGNPVLTVVLFGLPFGFLSLIIYSMCCQDILDADDEEEKEQLLHEKKE